MAKKKKKNRAPTYSLTLVPCGCAPGQSLGGGRAEPEFYDVPRDAALAVKGHVDRVAGGGHPFWAVHSVGPWPDRHVVFAVVDGVRYGPFRAELA